MRLILLYAAQVAFIVAGFAAITSVFVSINSDAMSSTVTHLLASTASLATSQALAPLDKFAVQAISWADMLTANTSLQCNNPMSVEWTPEDINMTANAAYASPLKLRMTQGKELKLSFHRNNPLAIYVYEAMQMPDNASQMVDCGSSRVGADYSPDSNYLFYSPSLHRGGVTASPDLVNCNFNFSEGGHGRLTPQVVDSDVRCYISHDVYASLGDYQVRARALTYNDSRTGKWLQFQYYYDPTIQQSSQTLTFSVPLTFSAPDPATGEYHCTNAACFDLNAQWLTEALHSQANAPGVHLALFWDLEEALVAWTLNAPSSDPATGALLLAGATGTEFDDAVDGFWQAGWCSGPGRISGCTSPSDSSSVSTTRFVFVMRRVVHVNARFTVVISGDHDTFFGPGERARAVGIGVSVAVCVVCLATSVALWLTTVRPLRRLISNMELASTFSSDVDAEGDSCITEVNEANVAFLSMREQLQMAKPFMPQHLLEQFDEARMSHTPSHHRYQLRDDMTSDVPTTAVTDDTRTAVSSRHSKSVRSVHSSVHGARTSDVLETRFVAILVVNISEFDKLVRGISAAELQAHYAKFIDVMLHAAKAHRGVLDSAQGDHVLMSFNTTVRCAAPAAKAVGAAFALRSALAALSNGWQRVTCGIAAGHAHCGTLGSSGAKSHATLGTVVRHAIQLQRVARALDDQRRALDAPGDETPVWCVATARVVQDCSTFAHFRYEALASLLPTRRTTVIASVFPPPNLTDAAHPHQQQASVLENSVGEWLYEVNATANSNPHLEHNARVHTRFSNLTNIAVNVADAAFTEAGDTDLYQRVARVTVPTLAAL